MLLATKVEKIVIHDNIAIVPPQQQVDHNPARLPRNTSNQCRVVGHVRHDLLCLGNGTAYIAFLGVPLRYASRLVQSVGIGDSAPIGR